MFQLYFRLELKTVLAACCRSARPSRSLTSWRRDQCWTTPQLTPGRTRCRPRASLRSTSPRSPAARPPRWRWGGAVRLSTATSPHGARGSERRISTRSTPLLPFSPVTSEFPDHWLAVMTPSWSIGCSCKYIEYQIKYHQINTPVWLIYIFLSCYWQCKQVILRINTIFCQYENWCPCENLLLFWWKTVDIFHLWLWWVITVEIKIDLLHGNCWQRSSSSVANTDRRMSERISLRTSWTRQHDY